jgi:cellulose synthase/poly-beta-1,6-N-acetylglucosamine synthase-like glycosyltransferase
MTSLLDWVLVALGTPVFACAAYLLLLTLLSARLPTPRPAPPKTRFRIVIPAHDESSGIGSTVENLRALDYPRDLFEILVIADNCTDDTADRARGAGADVLERNDSTLRGKGYALKYAFEQLPETVDAVVVIDADTVASPNLLSAFAARIDQGAKAAQADYAVRNAHAAWRTRLMAIAFGAFHIVRSRARERMGVSAGLRGNGMCFTASVLREVPHDAFSIVEDVEYGIRLGEAGHRVFYVDEAHVYGEMVSSAKSARSQRERWEGGRAALVRRHASNLLKRGLAGNGLLLDLAVDVLVPPLSKIAGAAVLGTVVATAGSVMTADFRASRAAFAASLVAIAAYVLRGWAVSGTGARGLADLALAPWFMIWKLTLARRAPARADAEWVRTTREKGTGEGKASQT